MTALECRPLRATELPQVLSLDQVCFGGLWSLAGYQRELDSPNSDLQVLATRKLSSCDDSIIGIGCLWAILDEAHITLLGIAPTYRKQGLGQWMLLQLLRFACDRGLTHATLEVRQSNQSAQRLYQKFGFKVAGERCKYYGDGENALILWKGGLQTHAFRTELLTLENHLRQHLTQSGWQVERLPCLPQPS